MAGFLARFTRPRQTRAQREWRPGTPKPRRSVRVMFGSVLLTLEAFAVFFGTLAAYGLHAGTVPRVAILTLGLALTVLLVLACAVLARPHGVAVGWALQLLVIATGVLEPMMFLVGGMFALTWWYAIHAGSRLDRENAERDRRQAEWERAQDSEPPAAGSSGASGEAR
jgi:hypothetical protein